MFFISPCNLQIHTGVFTDAMTQFWWFAFSNAKEGGKEWRRGSIDVTRLTMI